MRRLKHWRDARRAKKIVEEIIAKEGPPESEDEVAEIFKRAWGQLGYKVVDARAEFEKRGEEG
ncbi:unnamed protein product [marine sediment metagenome]|uniref:Uncharacterized protein n=1 Tax=marine sediment metagenome TaxID=412755 RepID=X1QBB4_9ZZZZ